MPRPLAAMLVWAIPSFCGVPDGAALFDQHCALCHTPGGANRTPTPEALRGLTKTAILAALETGVMKAQGAALTPEARTALASYLGRATAAAAQPSACPANPPLTNLDGWNGWSGDLTNTRFQSADRGGLRAADVPRLRLKWAFGFPGTLSVFGQPTVAGGRLFFGSSSGLVYSLDMRTGCTYWTFRAPTTVRGAITVARLPDGRAAAYFGDTHASVYAIDAHDGTQIWKTQASHHPLARVTGAPKLAEGRLYVPVASGVEEMMAAQPGYACCTFRGSVAAFDAASGKLLWNTYTIPDPPAVTGANANGVKAYGPSGAGVWGSPTVDLDRRVIYVGTGNNYSGPPNESSDAVLALDMDSGALRWRKQMNPGDAWNAGCLTPGKGNCPSTPGQDTDIGASPVLTRAAGKDVLAIGQKSGVVYGIDPDNEGAILWTTRIGRGGALGGVMWGMASAEETVYAPLSDFDGTHPAVGGGLFALRVRDGAVLWSVRPEPPACAGKSGCGPAQMAPATLIPGVVFSPSMDGHLRAYDLGTGGKIWDLDTLRPFDTVNGVPAHGGSLNATGAVVADGMLFVNSGYGELGGMPGNVLLALAPAGR